MVLLWVRAEKDSHVVGLRVSVRAHGAAVVASLTAYNEARRRLRSMHFAASSVSTIYNSQITQGFHINSHPCYIRSA